MNDTCRSGETSFQYEVTHMSVTVFTMTHKKFDEPKDGIYVPLHVGRAKAKDLGYAGDDTGDQISAMNCYYGELTGVYWIWKNFKTAGAVGVCHYRRYLVDDHDVILTEKEYETLLQHYDIITTKVLRLNCAYYDGYAANHHIKDLIETGNVIREKYPDYYDAYEQIVHSNQTLFGNIMVTSKQLFDEYAAWLFDIFFEVQKRIDIDSYDDYHKRVFGFISEILLLVWITQRKLSFCECKVGMLGEKKETIEMKHQLAAYFRCKDISGAKAYFLSSLEKRPDVLMEASDIYGELKLSMQVISTCDLEQQQYGSSVLDRTTDFRELMRYFSRLNAIAARERDGELTEEDRCYLRDENVSQIALQIAGQIAKALGSSLYGTGIGIPYKM